MKFCYLFEYLDGVFFVLDELVVEEQKGKKEMMMWNTATNNCVMTFEMDSYVVF